MGLRQPPIQIIPVFDLSDEQVSDAGRGSLHNEGPDAGDVQGDSEAQAHD